MHNERQREQDLQLAEDDEWLDQALRETFPASDPIPSFHKERQATKHRDDDPLGRTDSMSAED